MKTPFISVVVTTHRRSALLKRALRSVHDQHRDDIEVIVVADEGSAETALAAQAGLRDRDTFIRRSGAPGPARSRNLGVSLSAGAVIVFLDDDDTMLPGLLEALSGQHGALGRHIVCWNHRHVVEDRSDLDRIVPLRAVDVVQDDVDPRVLFVKNRIPNCCMAFPAHALRAHPFDERLRSLEDWDLLLAQLSCGMELTRLALIGSQYHHEIGSVHRNPASDEVLLPDYLSIYRKWPAPDDDIREARRSMLANAGLHMPVNWF